MNLNKVFILGRLTADPQVRQTPSGQNVATIGIATNRVWTDKNGARQEDTEFHNVVVWGRQAEIASQFLVKGSLVLIEGRIQTRSWQDKQGQQRKTTEIICERLQLGPRPAGMGKQSGISGSQSSPSATKAQPEELPTVDVDEPGTEETKEIKPEDLPF